MPPAPAIFPDNGAATQLGVVVKLIPSSIRGRIVVGVGLAAIANCLLAIVFASPWANIAGCFCVILVA